MSVKSKLVYGVGVNDYDGKVHIDGRHIRSYYIWKSMLRRCYDTKFHEKKPTYIGCLVADEWLSFSNFKKWYDKNYPSGLALGLNIRFELDKDLLVDGNKIYGSNTCIFLPQKVNGFLTNKQSTNTSGYTGVHWFKKSNKWIAQIKDFGTNKYKHLGLFDNIHDAAESYRLARELEAIKVKDYLRELGYSDDIINKIK